MTPTTPLPALYAYRPNAKTPLGRAYDLMIEEMRGSIEPEDLEWLNAHPLYWIRCIGMHRSLIHYRIQSRIAQMEALKPESGGHQGDWLQVRKEHKRWYASQLHWLQVLHVRRQEVAASFGYDDATQIITRADLVLTFSKILEAVKKDDWARIEEMAGGWVDKLTEKQEVVEIRQAPVKPEPPAPIKAVPKPPTQRLVPALVEPEPSLAPEPQEMADALTYFLSKIRGGR